MCPAPPGSPPLMCPAPMPVQAAPRTPRPLRDASIPIDSRRDRLTVQATATVCIYPPDRLPPSDLHSAHASGGDHYRGTGVSLGSRVRSRQGSARARRIRRYRRAAAAILFRSLAFDPVACKSSAIRAQNSKGRPPGAGQPVPVRIFIPHVGPKGKEIYGTKVTES